MRTEPSVRRSALIPARNLQRAFTGVGRPEVLGLPIHRRAGIVVKPGGKATLDVGNTPKVASIFGQIAQKLAKAA